MSDRLDGVAAREVLFVEIELNDRCRAARMSGHAYVGSGSTTVVWDMSLPLYVSAVRYLTRTRFWIG